jgi:lipopolysaccharide biosynthesis glycosyltransferase
MSTAYPLTSERQNMIPVVFVTDDSYVMQTSVAITSLLYSKNKLTDYDIYIISSDISIENQNILTKFFGSSRLHIINCEFDDSVFYQQYESNQIPASVSALLKFKIPYLLSQIDKAIYLDGDIIIRNDLTELFETNVEKVFAGVVIDSGRMYSQNENYLLNENYFNSGMMLLNLKKLRDESVPEQLFALKKKMKDQSLMDQHVFNHMFAESVVLLPIKYNLLYTNLIRAAQVEKYEVGDINKLYKTHYNNLSEIENEAVIIHYSSKDKPWRYINIPLAHEWYKFFKLSPFAGTKLIRTITSEFCITNDDIAMLNRRKLSSNFTSNLFVKRNYNRKLHIGIINWSVFKNFGGIQKMGTELANAMYFRGHDVTVIHAKQDPLLKNPVYPLEENINILELNLETLTKHLHKKNNFLTKFDFDVIVALFSWEAYLWIPPLLQYTGIPVVYSEHNNPEIIQTERWNKDEHLACAYASDAITVLMKEFKEYYPRELQKKIHVIPNAIAPQFESEVFIRKNNSIKYILGAGRFSDQHKQFSLLIEAFSRLSPEFPDWKLILCGAGGWLERYKRQINESKITNKVELPGMVTDMSKYYRKSNIFCIPSRYEGFGLVVCEAQQFELPTVGFAECSGVNEIIIPNESGILVENMDAKSLSEALAFLMQDASLREKYGKAGKENLYRYSPELIYGKWEALLQEVAKKKNSTDLLRLTSHMKSLDRNFICIQEILTRNNPIHRCDHVLTSNFQTRIDDYNYLIQKYEKKMNEQGNRINELKSDISVLKKENQQILKSLKLNRKEYSKLKSRYIKQIKWRTALENISLYKFGRFFYRIFNKVFAN